MVACQSDQVAQAVAKHYKQPSNLPSSWARRDKSSSSRKLSIASLGSRILIEEPSSHLALYLRCNIAIAQLQMVKLSSFHDPLYDVAHHFFVEGFSYLGIFVGAAGFTGLEEVI